MHPSPGRSTLTVVPGSAGSRPGTDGDAECEFQDEGLAPTDDADVAMLAATALGLSIVPREGAAQILSHLAYRRAAALEHARTRLRELHGIDEAVVEQARLLLRAAADEAELAG